MYSQIITQNRKDIVIRSGKRCVDFQQTVIQTSLVKLLAYTKNIHDYDDQFLS